MKIVQHFCINVMFTHKNMMTDCSFNMVTYSMYIMWLIKSRLITRKNADNYQLWNPHYTPSSSLYNGHIRVSSNTRWTKSFQQYTYSTIYKKRYQCSYNPRHCQIFMKIQNCKTSTLQTQGIKPIHFFFYCGCLRENLPHRYRKPHHFFLASHTGEQDTQRIS